MSSYNIGGEAALFPWPWPLPSSLDGRIAPGGVSSCGAAVRGHCRLLTIAAGGHRLVPKNPGESPVQCCAGPTMTALAGVIALARGVVG